jgi:hypothetical protein
MAMDTDSAAEFLKVMLPFHTRVERWRDQHDRDLQRFERESRVDEDRNPTPPDFARIWSDWDRYDAEQAQRWEVSGE